MSFGVGPSGGSTRQPTDLRHFGKVAVTSGLIFVSTIIEQSLCSPSMSADMLYSVDVMDAQAFVFTSALVVWR